VTVFGAAMSATGPAEAQATFDWVASRYTGFESAGWEIVSAGVSGDLACVVAIEHTTVSIGGAPAESYSLRATAILRREDGQWRAFHRHADPVAGSEPARDRLLRGAAGSTGAR
jgi:ketosteroid isomerase-like protein